MLFKRSAVETADGKAPERLRDRLTEFGSVVGDRSFPCFFATAALTGDQILFGLVGQRDPLPELVALMHEVAAVIAADPDQVVVVFVESPESPDLAGDQAFATACLKALLANDRVGWPDDAERDPDTPLWTFWFEGVELFLNFSTPRHVRRHSRNLGHAFTIVVQARSSFDPFGRPDDTARALIRRRLATYDDVSPHPALGVYGDPANREAQQYFLGDSTTEVDLVPEATLTICAKPPARGAANGAV